MFCRSSWDSSGIPRRQSVAADEYVDRRSTMKSWGEHRISRQAEGWRWTRRIAAWVCRCSRRESPTLLGSPPLTLAIYSWGWLLNQRWLLCSWGPFVYLGQLRHIQFSTINLKSYWTKMGRKWCLCQAPNLSSALCDLDLWPPDSQSWSFHALASRTCCVNLHQNRFIC